MRRRPTKWIPGPVLTNNRQSSRRASPRCRVAAPPRATWWQCTGHLPDRSRSKQIPYRVRALRSVERRVQIAPRHTDRLASQHHVILDRKSARVRALQKIRAAYRRGAGRNGRSDVDHERANGRSLNLDLYAKSHSWIGALKSHLPEDAVTGLSKEVLRRLKERGSVVVHQSPLDEQIDHLCDALLSDDDQAGARIIEAVRTDGASMEQVYLRYLGRAAEVLGQRWEDDLVSFTRMTLGTNRMYAIICTLRRQLRSRRSSPRSRPSSSPSQARPIRSGSRWRRICSVRTVGRSTC